MIPSNRDFLVFGKVAAHHQIEESDKESDEELPYELIDGRSHHDLDKYENSVKHLQNVKAAEGGEVLLLMEEDPGSPCEDAQYSDRNAHYIAH